jgi:large subunit ribosomal protein L18
MKDLKIKAQRRIRRKMRVRSKIFGTGARPRLSVFRSHSHIYGQLIDDERGITLVSSSDRTLKKTEKMTKMEIAAEVGRELAKKALAKKIKAVVFDKGGLMYHGRIKALADGAREGGLEF